MFTGIIETTGTVRRLTRVEGDRRVAIHCPGLALSEVRRGDSISVNGCCLTAVELTADAFEADVSNETLARTTLGKLAVDSRVNLERALTLSTPLGGHLVSGHVDGVGSVLSRRPEARSERWRLRAPEALSRYVAAKGSICVDGISLTVNAVEGSEFEVNIVPHTLAVTTLGEYAPGTPVNLEVDLIARYLERLLTAGEPVGAGVTAELLARAGFINR